MAQLVGHQHGKANVRLGRVWREGNVHTFVEWTVNTVLESDMAHAYLDGTNDGMTPTDTQKNTVYYMAKRLGPRAAPEDFAVALAKHFVATYPKVSKAKVSVCEAPWQRHTPCGHAHDHGYEMNGSGSRTAYAEHDDLDITIVHGGIKDWRLLKTTQSGYEGFIHDEFTSLPDTKDRILASAVTATWKYSAEQPCYHQPFKAIKDAMTSTFFGPHHEGVYSPSVQYTLFQMGKAALAAVVAVESVYIYMPNLHFLPCNPVNSEPFEDDVYLATSEPHGTIETTITRDGVMPHARL